MSTANGHGDRPRLDPTTQHFVDSLAGAPPIHSLSPEAARNVLTGLQSTPVGRPGAVVEEAVFPVGPTGSVSVRIVRPTGDHPVLPVVMHFHGGGWVLGDADTHDRLTREIAVGARAVVVFVKYDRSPEAHYPIAIVAGMIGLLLPASAARAGVDPAPIAQPNGDTAIRPFKFRASDEDLANLKLRIAATKWPEQETVSDASQGVNLVTMQKLAQYWQTSHDWRKVEARLNALPQFVAEIDGVSIHFIHVRSKHDKALPMIVTHGWPSSVAVFVVVSAQAVLYVTIFWTGLGITGLFAGMGPFTAELVPNSGSRGLTMGIAYNGGRLGGILAPYLIGALATSATGFQLGMGTNIVAFVLVAGVIWAAPETKGIQLV